MQRIFHGVILGTIALGGVCPAQSAPPPPLPADAATELIADCRTPPAQTIALTLSNVAIPTAPAALNLQSAYRVEAPAGARLGRVVGVVGSDSGAIVAVTSAGYWVRLSVPRDAAGNHPPEAVAVSIRDPQGTPSSMARVSVSPIAGAYTPPFRTTYVALSYADGPWLYQYEVEGCFPGGKPTVYWATSIDEHVQRILPDGGMVTRSATGDTFIRSFARDSGTSISPASRNAMHASVFVNFQLAQGCDELAFYREGTGTQIRTDCSTEYLARLANMEAQPQRAHRQPLPRRGNRVIGTIDAPIAAVSGMFHSREMAPFIDPVRRGDRTNPGRRCNIVLAAQSTDDAPITFYLGEPYCAYYPRDPSGEPFPIPPPP